MKPRKYSDMAADKAKYQAALAALEGIPCCRAAEDIKATLATIADYELFGIDDTYVMDNAPYRVRDPWGFEVRVCGEDFTGRAMVGSKMPAGTKLLVWPVLGGVRPFDDWQVYCKFLEELKREAPPDFINNVYENYYCWFPHRTKSVLETFGALAGRFRALEEEEAKRIRIEQLKKELAKLEGEQEARDAEA